MSLLELAELLAWLVGGAWLLGALCGGLARGGRAGGRKAKGRAGR